MTNPFDSLTPDPLPSEELAVSPNAERTGDWPPSQGEIRHRLAAIAALYPGTEADVQRSDINRIAFTIGMIAERTPKDGAIADIGGGIGILNPTLASFGFRQMLVDDFRDRGNVPIAQQVFERVHKRVGVNVVIRDVVRDGLDLEPNSLDTVMSYDSIEHWHHSPKAALKTMMSALKPGGTMILGVPNCVNLRKRLTIPFGYGKWSQMADWYEQPVFRGHVREPDVSDLHYIANDIGLKEPKIIGRNWSGLDARNKLKRLAAVFADRPLQLFPSLCSDLYMLGRKPVRT